MTLGDTANALVVDTAAFQADSTLEDRRCMKVVDLGRLGSWPRLWMDLQWFHSFSM